MLTFDEEQLHQELGQLPDQMRSAFAAACATRLWPVFLSLFPEDARNIETIITRLWDRILGVDEESLAGQEDELLNLIPDEDEGALAASTKDDSLSSLVYAIRSTFSGSPQDCVWAARRIYEATDRYASYQSSGTTYDELELLRSPVVQTELERQLRDLAALQAAEDEPNMVRRLRDRAFREPAIPLEEIRHLSG